ncbi:MAG: lysophospholipid acyltransferase family protein [bacterium]
MRFGYALCRALAHHLLWLFFGLKVRGKANIPPDGKLIIASNHRSNLDPLILGAAMPREVHYFAKMELFKNRPLAALIRYLNAFPVTRSGFDHRALRQAVKILQREEALVIFPEGTRAPAGGFLQAKTGIGWIAALSGAPIVPVYVHGTDRLWRAICRHPRIAVVIGKPLSLSQLAPPSLQGKQRHHRIADEILERIRTLSLETPGRLVKEKGPVFERDVIPYPHLR